MRPMKKGLRPVFKLGTLVAAMLAAALGTAGHLGRCVGTCVIHRDLTNASITIQQGRVLRMTCGLDLADDLSSMTLRASGMDDIRVDLPAEGCGTAEELIVSR